MPYYRIDDTLVHLKMARRQSPAPCCAPFVWKDGVRRRCMAVSSVLCDADVGPGMTCDMPLCPEHATSGGDGVDYCPRHAPTAPA